MSLLTYCRTSEQYPLTGKGDINTYAVFAELAYQFVAPHGRVGLLVPSGIASDMTTKDFFAAVAESNRLIRLYDFENRRRRLFPDVSIGVASSSASSTLAATQAATIARPISCSSRTASKNWKTASGTLRLSAGRHSAAESEHAHVPDLPHRGATPKSPRPSIAAFPF